MSLLTEQERETVATAAHSARIALDLYPMDSVVLDLARQLQVMARIVHRLAETPFDDPRDAT